MTLVPPFEIGLLNAWILSLAFLFVQFGLLVIFNRIYKGAFKRATAPQPAEKVDRFVVLLMIAAFIYSVFLPLEQGSVWFYIGVPIYSLGLIILIIASSNFATTLLDEPVTKGIYHYSRNPMYLGMFLVFIGISIASASWVFLLISIALITLINIEVVYEERFCLEKYGDAYREYMKRAPRWLGVPESGEK